MISFSISFFKVFFQRCPTALRLQVLFLLFVVLSMKFQLVLAALVGLASSALWNYPPISSFDQNLLQAEQTSYEQPRYLYTDANSSIPVVNATTLAVGAFYFGSIALGVLSVLNDAANAVAKHKAQKKVKKVKKNRYAIEDSFQPSFQPEEDQLDEEYERYEQELRQYKESYAEYLQNYADWAEKYGQDPIPPSIQKR